MSDPNADRVRRDMERWRIQQSDSFDKKLTKVAKLASVQLQRKINGSVKTPVNFTKNAVGFKYVKKRYGTINTIFIKDVQAKYLSHLIEPEKGTVEKMTPIAPNRKNKFGNVPNLGKSKLIKVKHKNGKELLINPNRKKNKRYGTANRIVAVKMRTTRRNTIGTWKSNADEIIRMVKNRMALV
ncbi:hypothetical protein [Proteus columbae]|uniref:hypothetical protein n=1 Tax=Proteus columbae TaxID=1987580 RepID=UPI00288B827B|nr:hypothetical protein [Proteus columbae]